MTSTARRVAFRNQPNKCDRCDVVNDDLVVHHKDRDRTNNAPGNLQILCVGCHWYEHHGRQIDESKEQTRQWLAEWRAREDAARERIESTEVTVTLPKALVDMCVARFGGTDISRMIAGRLFQSIGWDVSPYQTLLEQQMEQEEAKEAV